MSPLSRSQSPVHEGIITRERVFRTISSIAKDMYRRIAHICASNKYRHKNTPIVLELYSVILSPHLRRLPSVQIKSFTHKSTTHDQDTYKHKCHLHRTPTHTRRNPCHSCLPPKSYPSNHRTRVASSSSSAIRALILSTLPRAAAVHMSTGIVSPLSFLLPLSSVHRGVVGVERGC